MCATTNLHKVTGCTPLQETTNTKPQIMHSLIGDQCHNKHEATGYLLPYRVCVPQQTHQATPYFIGVVGWILDHVRTEDLSSSDYGTVFYCCSQLLEDWFNPSLLALGTAVLHWGSRVPLSGMIDTCFPPDEAISLLNSILLSTCQLTTSYTQFIDSDWAHNLLRVGSQQQDQVRSWVGQINDTQIEESMREGRMVT